MRIAIYGTGGAGGHFGARLAEAGEDVAFIARGEHLEAIRREGLVLEMPGRRIRVRPAVATDRPEEAGPADVVLLGVKTWQVDDAARAMGPMLGPETFVVPLQNGVEAAGRLEAALGRRRVVGGLCATFSWVEAPGRIRSLGAVHSIRFGELDRTPSARLESLRAVFDAAGIRANVAPDVHVALWEKFLFVVPFGGVGAVTRAPIGVTRAQAETRRMLETGAREVLEVGRARGVRLPDGAVERAMGFLDSLAPEGTASLQRDIAEGKPSELDAWNGAVVRLGREAGVATPLHEFITSALIPQELRARGQIAFERIQSAPEARGE